MEIQDFSRFALRDYERLSPWGPAHSVCRQVTFAPNLWGRGPRMGSCSVHTEQNRKKFCK